MAPKVQSTDVCVGGGHHTTGVKTIKHDAATLHFEQVDKLGTILFAFDSVMCQYFKPAS